MKTKNHFPVKICLTTLMSALYFSVYSQQPPPPTQVQYYYDAAGNRTKRMIIVVPPERTMDTTTKAIDEQAMQTAMQYGISVYPNPVENGKVNVTVSSVSEGETATCYLLDNNGKLILSQQAYSTPSAIDLSNQPAGIYFVKVAVEKEQLFYRVVKMK